MSASGKTSLGALALLVVALLACNDDEALPYTRLGIQTADSLGGPVTGSARSACVILPVLRGSRVDDDFEISGVLAVNVSADRDGVLVSFPNASPALAALEISKQALDSGFFQQVQVGSGAGSLYLVELSSDCETDAGN